MVITRFEPRAITQTTITKQPSSITAPSLTYPTTPAAIAQFSSFLVLSPANYDKHHLV